MKNRVFSRLALRRRIPAYSLLLSAAILLSGNSEVLAQELNWSAPATWGGRIPQAGDTVVVPSGKTIVLDVSTPELKSLTINGVLKFKRADLTLTTGWVLIHHGRLEIGTAAAPFQQRAAIRLTSTRVNENIQVHGMNVGTKFLAVMQGQLSMQGRSVISWTRLNATAAAGASILTLALPAPSTTLGWQVGDAIVIAPTDYNPFEAETRVIRTVTGTQITLDRPLTYSHYGRTQRFGAATLDERAEVGLLSHNIVVEGSDEATQKFGGHATFMENSLIELANVEFRKMGQRGKLGRYPMHFHLDGDTMAGSFVRNCAVNSSRQRGIVLHRTNGLTIDGNVVYNTFGHQFFLESATETGNTFRNNLGILTKMVPEADRYDPVAGLIDPPISGDGDNNQNSKFATFWISNVHNRFIGNVAAGVENGFGFWFLHGVRHPVRDADVDANYSDYDKPLIEFSGNQAHTIMRNPNESDTNLGYGPVTTGSGFQIDSIYSPNGDNPGVDNAPLVNCEAWKCNFNGLWFPNSPVVTARGIVIADCLSGAIKPQGSVDIAVMENCTIIARSANQPASRNMSVYWNALEEAVGGPRSLIASPASVDEMFQLTNPQFFGSFLKE